MRSPVFGFNDCNLLCFPLIILGCTPDEDCCHPNPPATESDCVSLDCQGYVYDVVQIGGQCWFADNLRNENYDNGDVIPAGLNFPTWSSTTKGAVAGLVNLVGSRGLVISFIGFLVICYMCR